VLVVAVTLGGGSSKTFIASLLFVRPISILCLGLLLVAVPHDWQPLRWPITLLALFAAWMAVQLTPLPPGWWSVLPGRQPFLEAAAAMGVAQPWRPLTLNPDLTLASLFALTPAAAVLVAYAGFTEAERDRTVMVVLAIALASTALALLQVAGGESSVAYTYAPTSRDLPVGLLANRNHQAALLALGLPVLTLWLRNRTQRQKGRGARLSYGLGGIVAVLFVMVALVSGSRAGLILCSGGIVAGALLFTQQVRSLQSRTRWAILGGSVAALALVILLATAFGRALVVERLDTTGISGDQRFRAFPVLMRLIHAYFPVGSGLGTFDPVFRMFEPDSDLDRGYFNNAHNDLIELAITGGLPALLLLAGFAAWFVMRVIGGIKKRGITGTAQVRGWVGIAVIVLLLAASLFDYPLRTPLLSMIFALACCWASALGSTGSSASSADGGEPMLVRP
jgi:O-antigen ligase